MRLVRLNWPLECDARAAWERLRLEAPTETIFLTPEWSETWWRHFGGGSQPAILAVREGTETRALAPVYRDRLGMSGLVALRPLGIGVSDYLDLLGPAGTEHRRAALAALLDGLLARRAGWDAIDLPNLPGESPTVVELAQMARERGLPCAVLAGHPRPGVGLAGDWAGYLASRPGRFRYNLRSRRRRLEKLGEVRFTTATGPEVQAALPTLTDLHARRWAGQRTATSFSSSPRGRAFYREACRHYAERGLVELSALEVDGRMVAGSLSFTERDTMYYYLPAWEPRLAAYAPSSLLLGHLIEDAFARGLRRFDFMLGDESYKAQWATEERRTVRLVIGNHGPRGLVGWASIVAWQWGRNRARRSALLQQARRYGVAAALSDRLSASSNRASGGSCTAPAGDR
ncbi:MAG: GNAT family N-acetyltransferase [Chloroflexi bacterium]|nr:GNAT family N-acetyltransferase [Chloroflexota bacterium]